MMAMKSILIAAVLAVTLGSIEDAKAEAISGPRSFSDAINAGGSNEHVWLRMGDLDVARSDASTTSYDGKVYIVGGCTKSSHVSDQFYTGQACQSISNVVQIYNPIEDTYAAAPALPETRYRHFAAVVGQKLYIIGGRGGEEEPVQKDVFVLDLEEAEAEWVTLGTQFEDASCDAFGFVYEGIIYVGGGYSNDYSVTFDTIYKFDPASDNSFSALDIKLNIGRGDAHAAVVGDIAYVVGGFDQSFNALASVETLHLRTLASGAQFSILPEPMSEAKGDCAVVALNKKLLIFGGQVSVEGKSYSAPARGVEVYDAMRGFHDGGALYTGRFRFHAAVVDNSVFLFGGQGHIQDGHTGDEFDEYYHTSNRVDQFLEHPFLNQHPTVELHGAGTTNPSKFLRKTIDMMEHQARLPLHMTYRAVGSSTGQKEFVGDAANDFQSYNHFGAGDIPLTEERYNSVTDGGKDKRVIQIPFALGAVGVFHSVPGTEGLYLNPCLLAEIFSGKVTMWNDEAIVKQNPFMKDVKHRIHVLHRGEGSSSTSGITNYLDATCSEKWTLGKGSSVTWQDSATPVSGSDGMSNALLTGQYSIGYLEAGHGKQLGLSDVGLLSGSNKYLNVGAANIAGAAASVDLPRLDEDFSAINLYNVVDEAGNGVWPITMYSYFYIRKDLTGLGLSSSLLFALIDYTLSRAGQTSLENFGFTALPEEVLNQAKTYVDYTRTPFQFSPFTTETGVEEIVGAGEYVLSPNRDAYASYDRKVLAKALSEATQTIEVLQANLKAQTSTTDRMFQDMGTLRTYVNNSVRDKKTNAASVIAMVLGVIGFLMGGFALGTVVSRTDTPLRKKPGVDEYITRNLSADPIETGVDHV